MCTNRSFHPGLTLTAATRIGIFPQDIVAGWPPFLGIIPGRGVPQMGRVSKLSSPANNNTNFEEAEPLAPETRSFEKFI